MQTVSKYGAADAEAQAPERSPGEEFSGHRKVILGGAERRGGGLRRARVRTSVPRTLVRHHGSIGARRTRQMRHRKMLRSSRDGETKYKCAGAL